MLWMNVLLTGCGVSPEPTNLKWIKATEANAPVTYYAMRNDKVNSMQFVAIGARCKEGLCGFRSTPAWDADYSWGDTHNIMPGQVVKQVSYSQEYNSLPKTASIRIRRDQPAD